jgi:hypothetical protein
MCTEATFCIYPLIPIHCNIVHTQCFVKSPLSLCVHTHIHIYCSLDYRQRICEDNFQFTCFRNFYILEYVYCIPGGQDVRRFIYIYNILLHLGACSTTSSLKCMCFVDRNGHFVH